MRKAVFKNSKAARLLAPYALGIPANSKVSNIVQTLLYSKVYVSTIFDVMNKVRMGLGEQNDH